MVAYVLKMKSSSWSGMGARLVKQKTKTVKWNGNGQKITRWPIKYPHIKKNAQHPVNTAIQVWVCASLLD